MTALSVNFYATMKNLGLPLHDYHTVRRVEKKIRSILKKTNFLIPALNLITPTKNITGFLL